MHHEAYDELVQSHDATTCAFDTESMNGDANRMAVCGESAGGSVSLVMSMLTKERQQPGSSCPLSRYRPPQLQYSKL